MLKGAKHRVKVSEMMRILTLNMCNRDYTNFVMAA